MTRSISLSLGAFAALASLASATTYVVDSAGGPGVDFINIPQAVAVAQPFDVIRVHPGSYSGFTLSVGVSILAQPGAVIVPPASIDVLSIPASQRAVICGLSCKSVNVTSCAGPVLLDTITTFSAGDLIHIVGCTDVRLRACTNLSVIADASRVEITNSSLHGVDGEDGCDGPGCGVSHYEGYPGTPALSCTNNATVHVGATSLHGGRGGAGGNNAFCPNYHGGDGGDGILLTSGSVLVTGNNTQTITGGTGGTGDNEPNCAPAGDGSHGKSINVQGGVALYSGVSIPDNATGAATQIVPADPCLVVTGSGVAGTQVVFTVYGQPGDQTRLRLGRQMVVNHLPNVFEDQLTLALRSYALGVMPPSGQLSFAINVPMSLAPGFVLVAQGSTTSPAGETRLTQSGPVAVR